LVLFLHDRLSLTADGSDIILLRRRWPCGVVTSVSIFLVRGLLYLVTLLILFALAFGFFFDFGSIFHVE
jgi:hypothetical protein